MAKGQKICPKCNGVNGCRSHKCDCGHVFESAKKSPLPSPSVVNTTQEPKPVTRPICLGRKKRESFYSELIYTPSGKCPVAWNGDVLSWAQDVLSYGNYTPSALKYWLRGLVPSEEFKGLAAVIDERFSVKQEEQLVQA